MDSLFGVIDKNLDHPMTEAEYWSMIAPIFSKIKCGHTRIYPSDNYRNYFMTKAKIFPFEIKIIGKKIFIAKNLSTDTTIRIGTEIISINKIPVSKIIAELLSRTWEDGNNQTLPYRIIEQGFNIWYNLVFGECEHCSMEIITLLAHKRSSIIVSFITMEKRKAMAKLQAGKANDKQLLQFNFPDSLSAVLSIKTFNKEMVKARGLDFNSFIDSSFALLKNKNIQKLIIDLRDNNGGDPELIGYLYSYLAEKEFNLLNYAVFKTDKRLDYFGDFKDTSTAGFYTLLPDQKGKFYWKDDADHWYGTYQPKENNYKGKVEVLVNGGTFSSSGFFCSLIKFYVRGELTGEESGGSYICNDCHDNLVLPNTKIKTEIARCTFSMNLPGFKYNEHGIIPDHIVQLTVDDLINGKDPVLDFAIKSK